MAFNKMYDDSKTMTMKKMMIHSIAFFLTFILWVGWSSSRAQSQAATGGMAQITVNMKDAKLGDTIRLEIFDAIYSAETQELKQPHEEYIAVKNAKGAFVFHVPVLKKLRYISLYKDKVTESNAEPFAPILREYMVEPNDKITIDIVRNDSYHPNEHLINNKTPEIEAQPSLIYEKQYGLHFRGNGSAKFRLRHLLDSVSARFEPIHLDSIGALKENTAISAGRKMLRLFKPEINPLILDILKADLIGKVDGLELRALLSYKRYDLISQYFVHAQERFSDEVIMNSRFYPFFIFRKYEIEYPNPVGGKSLSAGAYYFIKKEYQPGELRDKLLAMYVALHAQRLQNSVLEDAKRTIKTPLYLKMVMDIANQVFPGQIAYNFELPDVSGKKVKLSDFRGKVVFIDFWFTGCSACKGYYRDIVYKIEDKMSADTNMVFLTISIDRNKNNWRQSVKGGEYTSDKAVNLYTDGEGPLHTVIDHYKVQGYPRPMLIDRDGRVFTDKDTDLRSNGLAELEKQIHKAMNSK